MSVEKDKGQRRVYVLPTELVERIVAYQEEMGIQSEVEAARRLLDEALKSRDDWRSIVRRFKDRLKDTRVLSEIAKEVLIGHPLVVSVKFEPSTVIFALSTGQVITIGAQGDVEAWDGDGQFSKRLEYERPLFSSSLDDEDIPF